MNRKPEKGEYLEALLRSPKTVFTTRDIALLWGEAAENALCVRLSKYAKAGKLVRIHRGVYAKDREYNRFELATRIYTPSYISFETVLTRTGVNFQYYGNIFVASYVSRELVVDRQKISFVRMKTDILSNPAGINHSEGYSVATKERAFLDRVCVSKDYHFDHLDVLDWDKVFEILPIYHNKQMEKKVQQYFEHYRGNV
ncbi:MAG: type IV toxin-antitoxin system AbiEi family antitoxin domain-containing protein [Candidatus Moraniibacteriota bacterium]|nr:MAG: type IV toxin-antitoxin system AbiEi family antitoxin domain-containing protein [Candidatus Moranbacteria bacterium]